MNRISIGKLVIKGIDAIVFVFAIIFTAIALTVF